ncbi:MAG: PhzF family phenazine biosynthesis protein [Acidimicrobiales bacterium]
MTKPFFQVDVFTSEAYRGNPLAVVLDAESMTSEEMQRFANWTNLSETTFLLPPTDPAADYRVRIFTPSVEFPFAGHPTLGSAHVWLEAGGQPKDPELIVQECGVGLVPIRRSGTSLAFAAPPLIRSGPVDDLDIERVATMLGIAPDAIVDATWADNGPGWIAVRLSSVDEVRALQPGPSDLKVGVVALTDGAGDADIEARAFFPRSGTTAEDPVTGSLNASIAQWLLGNGTLQAPYVAAQGTMLGRSGRVTVAQEDAPDGGEPVIWVGGDVVTCIRGDVALA